VSALGGFILTSTDWVPYIIIPLYNTATDNQRNGGNMDEKLTRQQILAKVQKLMRLADGTNYEEESAAALNMARQLLAKHNLSMTDLEVDQEADPEHKTAELKVGFWQGKLAVVISNHLGCKMYYHTIPGYRGKQRTIRFIGMPTELELCMYMFESIERQIDKLCRKKRRELRDERQAMGMDRQDRGASSHYTRGYTLGIISRIEERLKEQIKREESDSTALVLVTNPKVIDWCNRNLVSARPQRRKSASDTGFAQGRADGNKVSLNNGLGQQKPNGYIE